MPQIVADTNVLSYMFKNHPLAAAYRPLMEGNRWAISFMSLAELHEGAARAQWGPAALHRLHEFLRAFTVVHSTDELSVLWGRIRAARRRQPISVGDAWIATTALFCACPLVTHNPADFAGIPGLQVVTAASDART
jgi:tRNA(fMet)-specific endonuclease VapC